MLNSILTPVMYLGGMSVIFGIGLGFAAIKLAVPVNEKVPLIRDVLPGANCGACGFAGCDALAEEIASENAKVTACPVGGEKTANAIAEIMGVTADVGERKTAFVSCNGTCENSKENYEYYGIEDCLIMAQLPSEGDKSCSVACLGLGTCVRACEFDAIDIVDGVAVVNMDKCTSCGMCIDTCPKGLIGLVKESKIVRVECSSKALGKDVNQACTVGCIGCKICEKNCPDDAIHVKDNLAKIDYEKCTLCGTCIEKCPKKCIVNVKIGNELSKELSEV